MKKTILTISVFLLIAGSAKAIDILGAEEKPAGCEPIAQIKAGDLFNRFPKDTAVQSVVADATRLGAQKVSVELVRHHHPKLGTDYTASGIAWKCAK